MPDDDYAGSTSNSLSQTISQLSITPTAIGDSKVYDSTTSITGVVVGSSSIAPGDSVTFTYTSAAFSSANAAVGQTFIASGVLISGTDAGNYTLASTDAYGTADITPAPTTTTLVSSLNPSFVGDNVTFTATVSNSNSLSIPDGDTVDFLDDGSVIGSGYTSSGVATFSTSDLAAGNHPITAHYLGSTNFADSTSSPSLAQLVWGTNDESGSLVANIDPLFSGAFIYGIPLDLDQSPGRDVGSDPGLVYNSATVDPTPVVQVTFFLSGGAPLTVEADLTLNGSSAGSTTLSGTGLSGSGPFEISVPGTADLPTDVYNYTVTLTVTYSSYNLTYTSPTSQFIVVNQDSSQFGAGWNLSYAQTLVAATPGGVLQVFGNGEGYYFPTGSGAAPPDPVDPVDADIGNVEIGNVAGSLSGYDLTTGDGDVYHFDGASPTEHLLTWTKAGGFDVFTFTWSGDNLASETTPDGAYTTFSGSSIVTTTDTSSMTDTLTQSGGNLASFVDPAGNATSFTYDGSGHLTHIDDGSTTTSITYANGMVASVQQGGAPATGFTPAESLGQSSIHSGPVSGSMTNPVGDTTTVGFNGSGRPQQVTAPDGGVTQYGYDANGYLNTSTDPDSRTTTYTNDSAGYPTSIQTPDGALTTIAYDGNHNVLTQTDPLGNTTTNTYSGGLKQTTTDPTGDVTSYTYTGSGDLETVTNPLGDVTTNVYDGDRRLQATVTPLGDRTTYSYDALGNPLTVENPLHQVATTVYDASGHLTESIDASGAETTYVYNAAGMETGMIGPTGVQTSYVFDNRGNQVSATTAVGTPNQATTTSVYDNANELIASIDADGRATSYSYDAAGRQVSTTAPTGATTTTVFDSAGQAVEQIDQYGNITTAVFDQTGRQYETIDPQGHISTTVFDQNGQTVASIDPDGRITSYAYDAAGRQVSKTDPTGATTTTVFDSAGQAVEQIDQYGNITTAVFDQAGRQFETIDPQGHIATTVFDAAGQTIASIDANGHTASYAFDSAGRQISETDAYGKITTTVYDQAGSALVTDPAVSSVAVNGGTVAIVSASESSTTVTVTTNGANGFAASDTVLISGMSVAGYNGVFTIASVPTANTFTFTTSSGLASATGGLASDASSSGTALSGGQRSMVDSVTYTFNQAVTIDARAFQIALHPDITINGTPHQSAGTLPTLNWASPDGGTTWVVTFSGSIAWLDRRRRLRHHRSMACGSHVARHGRHRGDDADRDVLPALRRFQRRCRGRLDRQHRLHGHIGRQQRLGRLSGLLRLQRQRHGGRGLHRSHGLHKPLGYDLDRLHLGRDQQHPGQQLQHRRSAR